MDCPDNRFPRFRELPAELRLQIWEDILPEPGFFMVQCNPVHIVHADQHDDRKTVRLALKPARHGPHGFGYQERVWTNRSLLAACFESREVVCKRFPDTLDSAGPRLSFQKDLIYVVSEFLVALPGQEVPGGLDLEFEGGWNKHIRRLAVSCEWCQMQSGFGALSTSVMSLEMRYIARVLGFLTTYTSVKQLFFTLKGKINLDSSDQLKHSSLQHVLDSGTVDSCGGLMCQPNEPLPRGWVDLTTLLESLRRTVLEETDAAEDIRHMDLATQMLRDCREIRQFYYDVFWGS